MYYTLSENELKPLVGLVQIGGLYKNAAFLTADEAASIKAYEREYNHPEQLDGYNAKRNGYELVGGKWQTKWIYDPMSVEELTRLYDGAMEAHLDAEKAERGYTKREPSDYANSTVPRYKQDAEDWTKHRDEVMLYGLDVLNRAARGEPVPTLAEFQENLPKIVWAEA